MSELEMLGEFVGSRRHARDFLEEIKGGPAVYTVPWWSKPADAVPVFPANDWYFSDPARWATNQ